MVTTSKGKSVLWAASNVQHIVSYSLTPYKSHHHKSESSPRSILRKSPQTFPLSAVGPSKPREVTPEPSAPGEDPNYLASPVKIIVSGTSSMPEIVEAYTRLCTRLKSMHQSIASMKEETPIPALRPIIENREELIAACDRDIRRALVNPIQASDENRPPAVSSASPKKGGMTDEEAKGARDMHLTCVAALRFTSLLLSSLRLEALFSTSQLLELLTAVLAIPLSEEMPSLNCRKTYAIAIGVLAASTLTAPVATEAASRITFALRRAIEGELGREGKKGAIADGLKAIRDLVLQHPQVFIPEFSAVLPGLFSQLSGASKVYQMLAAHVFGAMASVSHDADSDGFRRELDSTLGEAYQTLLKDLRSALSHDTTDAPWALCTLASIVTLTHGSPRAIKLAMNVLPIAMIHKKTGVRMMGSLVWRCYAREALHKGLREGDGAWQLLMQVLPMNVSLGLVAALLLEDKIEQALKVLAKLVAKGGTSCAEAVPMLQQIMSYGLEVRGSTPIDLSRYVPPEVFDGTLLYNPYSSIGSAMQKVMGDSIDIQSIRPLSRDSIRAFWPCLMEIWREAASKAEVGADGEMPRDLAEVWRLLLASRVEDDDEIFGEKELQLSLVDVLSHFLSGSELVWTSSAADALSSDSLKYGFLTNIWSIARESVPASSLEEPAKKFLPRILDDRPAGDSVASWAELVAHLTVLAPSQQCLQVLDFVESRVSDECNELRYIWNALMSSWTSAEGSWEDGIAILTYPCRTGGFDNYHDLDSQAWEECMRISFMKAQGVGTPIEKVVDNFVHLATSREWHLFIPRFTELIYSHVCLKRETLSSLAKLSVHALVGAYEKARASTDVLLKSRWLIRELTRQAENIKTEELISFLTAIQHGFVPWVRDEHSLLNENDYSFEIGNFFESILLSLKSVNPDARRVLQDLAPLFAAAFEGVDLHHAVEACVDPLTAFFECACSNIPLSDWPPIFIPRLRELPTFAKAFESLKLAQCPETLDVTKARNILVLSEMDALTGRPCRSEVALFATPRKRRHSVPDVPSMRKRKRTKVADENHSPSPSSRMRPRRSISNRDPLKPVELEEYALSPDTPTNPKERQSFNPRLGQRWILDCVCLPTLALYEKEQGIDRPLESSQIPRRIITSESLLVKQKEPPEQWPNSDDTLIGEEYCEYNVSPRKDQSTSITVSSQCVVFQ